MYQVKKGITIRPFGPSSKLEGPIKPAVKKWLVDNKKAKASDFEEVKAESKKESKDDSKKDANTKQE